MGLTKIGTDGVKDDAVTTDKLANAINTERTANTAKVSTTINNNADNRVITGSGTASTLNGESGLTYDGSDLNISNDVPQLILTDTNSNNSYGRVRGNGGNLILSADHGGATADSVILAEIDGSEKLRIDSSGTTTLKHSNDSGATTLKLENNSTHNSQNPKVKIAVDLASGKDGGSIEFIRGNNYQSSAAADSEIVISPTKNDSNTEIVRITQDYFRLHSNCSGIQFNSDTGAGNALNDYEKGSWIPTIYSSNASSNWTYTSSGRYVKVGHLVSLWGQISWTGVGGSGVVNIGGLPYSTHNTAANNAAVTIGSRSGWNYHRLCGQMHQSGYINIQFVDASGSYGSFNVSPGALNSSGYIYINWSYEAGT